MKTPALPRLKTLQAVSEEIGIPCFTLRRLIERGELRVVRLPGIRRLYLDAADVARALNTWASESLQ